MNEEMKKGMYIIPTTCYKCTKPMNVGLTYRENRGLYGPDEFSEEEKRIAKDHGVTIVHHYSGTRQESYDANTCPHCNAFVGKWYIDDDYASAVRYGDRDYKLVDVDENKVITYFVAKKLTRAKRKSDGSENQQSLF